MSAKIEQLQKDFYELNNMFALITISSQASDVEDYIAKVLNFIEVSLSFGNILFFIKEDKFFKSISSKNSEIQKYLNLEEENKALLSILATGENVEIMDEYNSIHFQSFLKKHGLENENITHIRIFGAQDSCFALAAVCKKTNGESVNDVEADFLNKVFNYIEPMIFKLIKNKDRDKKISELQKSLYNMSILYNVSQAVNFIDDLKRLLQVILSKALMTLEAEKGSLMLYDYSENSLQVKVVYGLQDEKVENDINNGLFECAKIKAGEGVAGTVFLEKKAIITNLGSNDPRFVKFGTATNTDSLLCVPLIAKNEAIGVINISNKQKGKLFNQQDLEFMSALASQAAIAIDNAKLYELATKDGLTKLYIYRHFYTLLENEIRRCFRYKHKMSLLMMDIDNFKLINDTYGHLVGDQILREISAKITQNIRKIDTPARYGGEEFAIILPETSLEEAIIIAERMRISIKGIKVEGKNKEYAQPTISIGIAEYPTQAQDGETLIGNADIALYYAKAHGKDVVSLYREDGCELVTKSD